MAQLHLFAPVAVLADHLPDLEPTAILVLASSERHIAALSAPLSAWRTHVFTGAKVHVPIDVVEAAEAKLTETGANVVVAIGGGSPIGLGKALKLRAATAQPPREVRFVAVPTTYAGSENTSIYGITHARDKQTGRDERVRPDIIVSDVDLTVDLPIAMTVQSLCNAIAHVASVLSTDSLPSASASERGDAESGDDRAGAAKAARAIVGVIERLLDDPRDRDARARALRSAAACAQALDRGKPGVQHAFAHLLGGAFGVDHAPLHSILLPRFLASTPAVRDQIERADVANRSDARADIANRSDFRALDVHLLAMLERAGAPTTLGALGITPEALDAVLATRPELPGDIARAAL